MNNAETAIESMNKAMARGINPSETNAFDYWSDYDLLEGQEIVVSAKKNGEYRYINEMGELGDDPEGANRNILDQIGIAKSYGFAFCRLEILDPIYVVVCRDSWDIIESFDSLKDARAYVYLSIIEDMELDECELHEILEKAEYEKFYQIVYKLQSTGAIEAFRD